MKQNYKVLQHLCVLAAEKGDVKTVSLFKPWDIRSSMAVLEAAAKNGRVELCKILSFMPHRINIIAIIATRWGHIEVVREMLDKGCDELDRIAEVAVECNRIDVIRLLLDRGYENRKYILGVAQKYNNTEIVFMMLAK